jgi:hypothetical protein
LGEVRAAAFSPNIHDRLDFLDFAGTAPQVPGNINCPLSAALACGAAPAGPAGGPAAMDWSGRSRFWPRPR